MDITTSFKTTPRTIMQAYRACHRTAYFGFRAGCLGVILAVILAGVIAQSVFVTVFGVVFGVVLFVRLELSIRRQLAPYMKGALEVTVTMTDTEYKTAGSDLATTRAWTAFTKVVPRGGFWVLRASKSAAMALPKSALNSEETSIFVAAMTAKGLLKSASRVS